MKTVVIIGGSKGVGEAILRSQLNTHKVINISRSKPSIIHENLLHYNCDILVDELSSYSHICLINVFRELSLAKSLSVSAAIL